MSRNNYYTMEFIEILGAREEIMHSLNVYCSPEELYGMIEEIKKDMEKEYGNPVYCHNIIKEDKRKKNGSE